MRLTFAMPGACRAPHAGLSLLLALQIGCGASKEPDGGVSTGPDSDGGNFVDAADEDAALLAPAEPGVCFGPSIQCDPPSFTQLEPSPENVAECLDAEPIEVVWEVPLGTVDCRLPDCPIRSPVVAGRADTVWAVSLVREPSASRYENTPAVAFAAQSFDREGQPLGTVVTDVRSQLEEPMADQTIRSISVTDGGDLLWAAPMSDSSGVELRRYARGGDLVSERVAVTNAWDYPGHAVWLADESVILAYRYRPEPPPDGAAPGIQRIFTGVARFDPDGRLVWNQSLLGNALLNDNALQFVVALGDVDDAGNAILRVAEIRDGIEGNTRLMKLDADGNLAWAVEIPNSVRPQNSSQISADVTVEATADGVLVAYDDAAAQAAGSVVRYVERLSPGGASLGRTRVGVEYVPPGVLGFDASGRMILANADSVTLVDPRAQTCEVRSRSIPCTEASESCYGDPTSVAVADDGDLISGGLYGSVALLRP